MDQFGSGGGSALNGLGSLADELADTWGEDEDDEEPDMNFQEEVQEEEEGEEGEVGRDSSMNDISSPTELHPLEADALDATSVGRNPHKHPSEYDGSDYRPSLDLDSLDMSPALVSRIDLVESLARRGTESTGGDQDTIVKRVLDGLKDLGGQSGVESGATRFDIILIRPYLCIY